MVVQKDTFCYNMCMVNNKEHKMYGVRVMYDEVEGTVTFVVMNRRGVIMNEFETMAAAEEFAELLNNKV